MPGGISVPVAAVRQPTADPSPSQNTYQGQAGPVGRIQGQFSGGPAFSGAAGAGLTELGEGFAAWGDLWEQQELRRQNLEALEEVAAFQDRERERLAGMQELKGPAGREAVDFMKTFYDADGAALLEKSKGQHQRQYYQAVLSQARAQGLNRAQAHLLQEVEHWGAAVTADRLARLFDEVEVNPENRASAEAEGFSVIEAADPGRDHTAQKMEFSRAVSEKAALALARAGHYDQAERLLAEELNPSLTGQPDRPALTSLFTPGEIVGMRKRIDLERIAQAKAEDETIKRLGIEAQKQIIDMVYKIDGQSLTENEVAARRDVLSPADYEKYMEMARNGARLPDKTEPEVTIELMGLAASGNPDLQSLAAWYLREGRLTSADYRTFINEGQQWATPAIRRAQDIIKASTVGSEANPDPDAQISQQLALQDLWAYLDGPGKNDSDNTKIRKAWQLGNNYRTVAFDKLIFTMPVPTVGVIGSRLSPDFEASAQRIEDALANGEIIKEQACEDFKRLDDMKNLLDRQTNLQAQSNALVDTNGRPVE